MYGNARAETPRIDALAASGVRFTAAYAHNVITLASHANILSGRLPFEHGVHDNSGFRFPAGLDTAATLLKRAGYRTGAFVSAFTVDSQFGLDRGFDVYDDDFADAGPRPAFLIQERPGTETVQRAKRWIDGASTQPYFCWVHIFEPHYPYTPPEPFAARFADRPYDGEVAAADAALAPLLDPILNAGTNGGTLVILTSDHGESLGEHGEATHGIFAYDATLKVPLVVYAPQLWRPRVIDQPAFHIDLLPTMLDAVGLPVPSTLRGRSLVDALAGGTLPTRTGYFEALSAMLTRGWAPLRGIIDGESKYIDLPIRELYDLRADLHETRNLADGQPARADAMRSRLVTFGAVNEAIERSPENAEVRERLRSLGYLSGPGSGVQGPGSTRYTGDDDPKRLIDLESLQQEVIGLYMRGDLNQALTKCRELVARRPTMATSLLDLAHLEREAGHLPAAIDALERALALRRGDAETAALLGGYLTQANRAQAAVSLLQPYAREAHPDTRVLVSLAIAQARIGDAPGARATIARARDEDPSSAMLLVDSGTVYLMGNDREQARTAFEHALQINPKVARAHSSLGMLDAESGR
ncbi:MAG TPA: sulfatase-like hydrolase/transferase, partial [Coriobacteriia bacterium]